MWWAGSRSRLSSQAAALFLGTRSSALLDGGEVVRVEADRQGQAILELTRRIRQRSRWRRPTVRIWLSGGLCRAFMMEVPAGLRGEAELHALAAGLAPRQTGLEAPCEVWVEPGQQGGRRVVAVVETRVLREAQTASTSGGVQLSGVSAWWSAVQRHVCSVSAAGSVAIRDEDSLTLLRGSREGFNQAQTWFPVNDDAAAASLIRRWELEVDDEAAASPVLVRLNLEQAADELSTEAFPFARWTFGALA